MGKRDASRITPEMMVRAYSIGLFPMAPDAGATQLDWYDPDMRGILPLDGFHVARRLLRTVLSDSFTIVADRDFGATIRACAAPAPGREKTWINEEIVRLFCDLHAMGYAHSVESWRDGELVGGLYGVAIGGAFFGESMFSRCRDASKVALVALVARLRVGGYTLLDTQFGTEHLARFGGIEIPSWRYKQRLAQALAHPAAWPDDDQAAAIRQEIVQMRADGRGDGGAGPAGPDRIDRIKKGARP
ncbi:leucyl/phenylalanyl-tRNA--protein transferase [Gluconacetobacter tumulisoli]|uniref:Leucyl/phenylalanyl-tRNA--protein transferase n=1 Tax=Gluconacetobacter tumulisoli TaxID=1286189 RepID=A0A7W4K4E5_9PROT|nr:leucyl/phenylalanyl-tRNA--protein transferase [Gluconacetobacter tumulisoli]MBB2200173.1 leucyl/phenylalanyl-tRNA--protein transferase [Gluconacetobacter tumulisoli]